MKYLRKHWAKVLFLLWAVFIFSRSLQPAELSKEESGRLLLVLQQLFPFELTQHLVRKAAHFIEYAILGFFGWFVFETRRSWDRLVYAMFLCLLTALCDETIQLFVEGRGGMVADIWLDMAGVLGGVIAGAVVPRLFYLIRRK